MRGIKTTIPKSNPPGSHRTKKGSAGGRPPAFDFDHYKQRHAVECGINQLKQNRTVATRYGTLAVRYHATVRGATINQRLQATEDS